MTMKIALIGYGKMGKEIDKQASLNGHEILFRFDLSNFDQFTIENIRKADVAIEFTQPDSAFNNYLKCFEAGIPVVSGTTGWLNRMPELRKICKEMNATFLYGSNFSIGVNILFRLNKILAGMMNSFPGYTVTVEEIHHTEKKDAPSGTAITIADAIIEHLKRYQKRVNEKAVDASELAVRSVRDGDVPGIHTIRYESDVDYIELTHSAKNRLGFVEGALTAAQFVIGRKGFYTMDDLLGI